MMLGENIQERARLSIFNSSKGWIIPENGKVWKSLPRDASADGGSPAERLEGLRRASPVRQIWGSVRCAGVTLRVNPSGARLPVPSSPLAPPFALFLSSGCAAPGWSQPGSGGLQTRVCSWARHVREVSRPRWCSCHERSSGGMPWPRRDES